MSVLGERIKLIISERNLTQVSFAKSLGISANYVNLIVNGKKVNISDTLAKLIEETYGYSAAWVLDGSGEKYMPDNISAEKSEIIKRVKKMSEEEVTATLAFVRTLEEIRSGSR